MKKLTKSVSFFIVVLMLCAILPLNALSAEKTLLKDIVKVEEDTLTATLGDDIDTLNFAQQLSVTNENDESINIEVQSWKVTEYPNESTVLTNNKFDKEGKYVFKPVISDEYELEEGVILPEVLVSVKQANIKQENEENKKYTPKAENECSIDDTEYTTLANALATINPGENVTIKLLKNVLHNDMIFIGSGINLTMDLNGYDLNIETYDDAALVIYEGSFNYKGDGNLNIKVTGNEPGFMISGIMSENSKVRVQNVTVKGLSDTSGIHAISSDITVNGNVTVEQTDNNYDSSTLGIEIYDTDIVINGNVSAKIARGNLIGISSQKSNTTINGSVYASAEKNGSYLLGIFANLGDETIIKEDLIVKGVAQEYNMGILCYGENNNTSKVTIDGTFKSDVNYIVFEFQDDYAPMYKNVQDYDDISLKDGYLQYSNPVQSPDVNPRRIMPKTIDSNKNYVWVKKTAVKPVEPDDNKPPNENGSKENPDEDKITESSKTGDNNNMLIWTVIAAVSLTGAGVLIAKRKRI